MELLAFFGLDVLSGMELLFAGCALLGGLLFLSWFVLAMIGGVAGDVAGDIFGADVGFDADLSFKALTFQGISAFTMMFGLIGLAILRANHDAIIAIFGGSAAGGLSMYAVAKLFEAFLKLESEGTMKINQAIGARGTVYLRIPSTGTGQVQVTVQGTERTLDAISNGEVEIATGTYITVVDSMGSVLVVEPLTGMKARDNDESE
ncbi:MAG TPA: NfeD family protein [Candidatus Thalassarchaeaceae archaeon]|nr:NfeD family protein [Candidatus Thalassarchaeaceae archaeon]